MKKIKVTLWIALLALVVFLSFYGEDNYYLTLKSADKSWSTIAYTLDDIVKKGDYVEYIYEPEQENTPKSIYQKRFAQQAEALNQRNAPRVLNTYLLKSSLGDIDGKEIVEFEIIEKSTGQVIEKRAIQAEHIEAKSIIPGIIALFGTMLTMRPILSLLAGIWVGASMHSGNSFTLGLHDLLLEYIPYGLTGNGYAGLKIAIFLLCLLFVLRMLARTGAAKTLADEKYPLKLVPLVLSAIHPYIFISFGAWWYNAINKNKPTANTEFPFQGIGVAIQPLILASPFLIPLTFLSGTLGLTSSYESIQDNLHSLSMRYASFAIIAVSICYVAWSKKTVRTIRLIEPKPGLKNIRSIPYLAGLALLAPIPLTLVGFNHNSILVLSGLMSLLLAIFYSTKSKTISSYEILRLAGTSARYSIKYIFYIILTIALGKVLYDLGAVHYMISAFSVDASSSMFFVLLFLSSLISSAFMGGCLISAPLLISSFAPLMGYQMDAAGLSTATVCIIEGSLMGELFCPYSPTAIISSALYGSSLPKHVIRQLPYITLATVLASITGFWMYGLGVSQIINYTVMIMVSFMAVLAIKKYKKVKN